MMIMIMVMMAMMIIMIIMIMILMMIFHYDDDGYDDGMLAGINGAGVRGCDKHHGVHPCLCRRPQRICDESATQTLCAQFSAV